MIPLQSLHQLKEIRMNETEHKSKARPHGIGGSDIAALLGLSPYKTALQLWAEKVGHPGALQPQGIHLRFGQHLEPFVASEYEQATGLHTREVGS